MNNEIQSILNIVMFGMILGFILFALNIIILYCRGITRNHINIEMENSTTYGEHLEGEKDSTNEDSINDKV